MPFDLSPKYPDLLTNLPFTGPYIAAAALVTAITILAFLRRRTSAWLIVAWICYLALLAPFTGPFHHPHHTYDRYSYIVGAVWAAVLAGGIVLLLQRRDLRLPVAALASIVCCFFGWQSQQQTFIWKNSLNLHSWMAESLGNSEEAAGHSLVAARMLLAGGYPAEALIPLRRSLARQPETGPAWGLLGQALNAQDRIEPAIAAYEKALKMEPNLFLARRNLALTLAKAERHGEAVDHFAEFLRRYPGSPDVHKEYAQSLLQLDRTEQAQRQLEQASKLETKAKQ